MHIYTRGASWAVLAALFFRLAAANCYYPDGTEANDVPCSDSTDESTCCGSKYACYGLESQYYMCVEMDGNGNLDYVRGSCTDESWRSSSCPDFCIQDGRDNTGGGNGVGQCPDSVTNYFCDSEGLGVENCTTDYDLIEFAADPTFLTTIGVAVSTSSRSASSSSTSSLSTMSTSTTSSSSSSSSSTRATSTASTTSATVIIPTVMSAGSSGLSSGGKAGVGVGVGVGSIVVIAIFFLAFRAYKKKQQDSQAAAAVAGFSPRGPGGGAPYAAVSQAPPGYAPAPVHSGYEGGDPRTFSSVSTSAGYSASYQGLKQATVTSSPTVLGEMSGHEMLQHELA